MRVVVAPVLVGDRICRIVAPLQSLLEVEEWVGAWWEPSSVTLTEASVAPIVPAELLTARGVPLEDRLAAEDRPAQTDIEALIHTHDPERPATMRFDEEVVMRASPARRRKYPGNARFRRNAPKATDTDATDADRRANATRETRSAKRPTSDTPLRPSPDGSA
ncbi:MAG: hypothetical protein H7099_15565 [Gemmatimonadaceae bacterium]|nr:hypothetical protein [Gemmatimonadaceae bacterium]